MQHHNNNCVVLLHHWSSFYSSMTQPWNSMRMCTVYLIVKCLSSCIFALIFALSPSAISQNGLFLKWLYDYHITLNLGYLYVTCAGSDVCLIQEGNNILHLTLSGIRNANSNITTPTIAAHGLRQTEVVGCGWGQWSSNGGYGETVVRGRSNFLHLPINLVKPIF